jgi:tetratricopeptide (TPR) repeat protein
MPRLYLVVIALFTVSVSFSQTELKKYLDYAKEMYEKGDYVHSLSFYEKAMDLDSSAIHTLWEYAEALRAYKDYRKAEYYYGEIFQREGTELFPNSLLYFGLMQKHNGKYDAAIETFKKAKKVYRNDKKAYQYLKSKREFESCLWAKSNLRDTSDLIFEHLPEFINTKDAEFAHRVHNNQLLYSSLRADSIGGKEEVYSSAYKTRLFQSEIKDSSFQESNRIEELFMEQFSAGNGSFSLDGNRFYFSLCKDDNFNYKCKIMVALFEEGKFLEIDTLGAVINEPGFNTTMPFIGEWDGNEVLFYASDRDGGKGGMDIWYSFITNGNQYKTPQNVKRINTIDNELSPFWDGETMKLYFSSSWHDGFGGHDIFSSSFKNNSFEDPANLGIPVNSPTNDLYYFETITGDSSFFSSNRLGTNYSKNPTCCSDIFLLRKPIAPAPPSIAETLEDLNKRLPVTLYFHNDVPNPRSWDSITNVNYINSYDDYTAMLAQYKKEYSKGRSGNKSKDAEDDIEDFFVQFVDQGVKDLFLFRDLLLDELKKGRRIQMTVKGFASPLAKTDYNVNLTKRRIWSLKNYLMEFDNGVFRPFFENNAESGGQLMIVEVPFGEYIANQITSDNPNDVQNSVYSRAAAIERKIEIQSVDVIKDTDTLSSFVTVSPTVQVAGEVTKGTLISKKFTVKNTGETPLELNNIEIPCECNTAVANKTSIAPGEMMEVKMTFDTTNYSGHTVKSVTLIFTNELKARLVITSEVK